MSGDDRYGAAGWKEKSRDEKLRHRLACWLDRPVAFATDEAEHAYRSRVRRLTDAILLERTPDRVPVPLLVAEIYPLLRAGLSTRDAMYDFARASRAFVDFNVEFQPDAIVSLTAGTLPGRLYELLDYRLYSWPGHGAPRESTHQYNEAEWMRADDYDELIDDPNGFFLRTYSPRVAGALAGFEHLGSFCNMSSMHFAPGFFATWDRPEVRESLERLLAAASEAAGWVAAVEQTYASLERLGFPRYVASSTQAPFDLLGDHLRGTRAIALDMYRRPEKVLAACESLVPLMIRWVLDATTPDSPPCVFWPLHKGADGLMGEEQFKLFYWPTLRTVALALIDEGFIPVFFGEGTLDARLELIAADVPPGRTVWLLDRTDMAHAKATLGKVAALQGNVPLSLLRAGSADDVREYCRRLIETAAPGGGFLLDTGAALHTTTDANIRAMLQAARDFGVY